MTEIITVCNRRINPIARGWFIWVKIVLKINLVVIIINLISGGSLIKILILGISDKVLLSFWSFKRPPLSLVYKTNIFIKLLKLMMIYLYINISFFCGIWVFSSNRKHLLATLLRLEFIVLTLYFVLYYYLTSFNFELFFRIVFLTFSVCEGALGLSILVSIIRRYGRDFFSAYSILQC